MLSQQESEEMEEACQCASDSEVEPESPTRSDAGVSTESWWLSLLQSHFTASSLPWPDMKARGRLQVVSACTGCSAEASALQAGWTCDSRF